MMIVISQDSRLKDSMTTAIATTWNDLNTYKNFIWQQTAQGISASYRGTVLGFMWALITPLVPISVYVALYSIGILNADTQIPKLLFVATGFTFWQLFSSTLTTMLNRPSQMQQILKKVRVPLPVIYVSGLGGVLFEFFVRVVLLIAITAFVSPDYLVNFWILPFLAFSFAGVGLGAGIFFSLLGIYLPDLKRVVSIFLSYAVFASGVIFPIPEGGLISEIVRLNPLYHLIQNSRNTLFTADGHDFSLVVLTSLLSSLFLLWLVRLVYRLEPRIMEAL